MIDLALGSDLVVGDDFRRRFWRAAGASEGQADELVAYAASLAPPGDFSAGRFPLADAPWVAAWQRYVDRAARDGVEAVLRDVFVQLRFPIQAGNSADPAYRAATRRGLPCGPEGPGLAFDRPDQLRVFLHPTPAGRVPVVLAGSRTDFERLVQAIVWRNQPEPVPRSMGACLVSGYNNWERVAEQRGAFERDHPDDRGGAGWAAAFAAMVERPERYQDRFLLASAGPYSAVSARDAGLDDDGWRDASIRLRIEHECTHYFTRQVFGAMRKSLLDELVADYMGMIEALGRFDADLFLRFLGLEDHPRYRQGGRLENYRGQPPLSDAAFALLPGAARGAALHLDGLHPAGRSGPLSMSEKAGAIEALFRIGLEGLASDAGPALLAAAMPGR